MKNKIKILTAIICLFALILPMLLMAGCSPNDRFDAEWIIGKTSDEIKARYGEYDRCHPNYCAYKTFDKDANIFEEIYQFFIDIPSRVDLYYVIYFDSSGHAYSIQRDVILDKGG